LAAGIGFEQGRQRLAERAEHLNVGVLRPVLSCVEAGADVDLESFHAKQCAGSQAPVTAQAPTGYRRTHQGEPDERNAMGHWETESGEIVLPSAEFAAVRQAVQKATHEHQTKVFEETQTFWKGLTRKEQTDSESYLAALKKHTAARHQQVTDAEDSWRYRPLPAHIKELNDDVEWRLSLTHGDKPARVLKSDLPFPTNRTTDFPAGEGSVTFDKGQNAVHWETGQYRNVIETARNSVAGEALFNRIKTVKWTRGTGGVFHGDNEISHEETDRGEYVTTAYGPIGAAQEPTHCEEYADSKGHRVTGRELSDLQQELWKAQRKMMDRMNKATAAAGRGKTTAASTAGSFASRGYRESNIRLY
jgi:hypothetical protein